MEATKIRLLDLFCGAGGAAMGYSRAGFAVVGVDIDPMPHYPFEFHQADAMTFPLDGFDMIHASPPCQEYSQTKNFRHSKVGTYPKLIEPLRVLLEQCGTPWVIENTPGAPMRVDLLLCGSMFGLPIRRHRIFEFGGGVDIPRPLVCDHNKPPRYKIAGHSGGKRRGIPVGSADEWRAAMGTPWIRGWILSEAIPPAYTEYIGRQLLDVSRGQRGT